MSSEYRKLSKDEISDAASTNLIDFLNSRGSKLDRRGGTYFWTGGGNDSVAILPNKPNMFKHFATGDSGNAIHFCQKYLNMEFQEAVEALLGARSYSSNDSHIQYKQSPDSSKKEPFVPPERDNLSNQMLFNYLSVKRGLSTSVIFEFYNTGSMYATMEASKTSGANYSNVAFIAKDFDGNPQGALKRSFSDNGFKGNHSKSNMRDYCFRYDGDGENSRLFVFEAPIDMLSFITIMEQKEASEKRSSEPGHHSEFSEHDASSWKKDSYLALGGLSPSSLLNYVTHSQNQGKAINEIWLCLDNDTPAVNRRVPGLEAAIKMVEQLKEVGFEGRIYCYFPKGKDWNIDLLNASKHDDWQKGTWSNDFTSKHISRMVCPGDESILGDILSKCIGEPQCQQANPTPEPAIPCKGVEQATKSSHSIAHTR